MRSAEVQRNTLETQVRVKLDLDGRGSSRIATGVGFFDHMLELMGRHALFDMELKAEGDIKGLSSSIWNGSVIAAWISRLPATRDRLDADPRTIGLTLLTLGLGSLVAALGLVAAGLGVLWIVTGHDRELVRGRVVSAASTR